VSSQSRVVIHFNHLPRVKRDASAKTGALIRAVGFEVERDAKQSMGTSPSPVGGPPGVDTGELRASGHTEMIDALTALVEFSAAHAMHQEFGTSKMGARPFLIPALIRGAKQVERLAKEMSWA